MITVATLITALQACDQSAAVILSSDAEGNDYHHLHGIDDTATFTDTTRTIEFHATGGSPCIVLYPEH